MSEEPEAAAREPAGHRASLAEQELVNSLGWLITVRWWAGASVLVATVFATRFLGLPLPVLPLVSIGLFILGYNLALAWTIRWLRRTRADKPSAYEGFARLQIGLDWLAMTALIAHSGGAESPAVVFFLFHITIASLLLPHRHVFLYVTLAPVLVGGVAALEYVGILPHVASVEPSRHRDAVYVAGVLVFFTASCYMMAYVCMTIARRLRRRENELSGLYESVRQVTSTLELQPVLDRIVNAAGDVLGCRAAAIRLVDHTGSQVEFAASWGLSDAYRDEVPGEIARSRLDQETLTYGVVFVHDIEQDPRIWHPEAVREEGIGSMLSVPLVGRLGPLGVLRAYGGVGHRFGDEDAAYLKAVAAHGVAAIENAKAYRLLAELDREKSKFIRITTHELRSPVRVTESLLLPLAAGYAGPLSEEQTELVSRAQRRLASLHALIDDLLDLAAGKVDLVRVDRHVVDLAAGVSDLCDHFRPLAEAKGIRLELKRPEGPLDVWVDPADLDRVVNNLLSNAVKYTRQGRVAVTLAREPELVRLDVSDSGIGIPTDALPHLFDEFYRAPNAKAVEESGTGLGLSIVKQLVDRYGGHVSVASEEGRGTTFTVALPLAEVTVSN